MQCVASSIIELVWNRKISNPMADPTSKFPISRDMFLKFDRMIWYNPASKMVMKTMMDKHFSETKWCHSTPKTTRLTLLTSQKITLFYQVSWNGRRKSVNGRKQHGRACVGFTHAANLTVLEACSGLFYTQAVYLYLRKLL